MRESFARRAVRRYLKRIQDRFPDLKDLNAEELSKIDEYVFRTKDGSTVKDWHGAFEILKDRHGDR